MRYQRLDPNLLVALRALLAERNVTRAAQALHVTQSAMGGILARLRQVIVEQAPALPALSALPGA